MKSDSIVIIPTYNEKENIEKIIRAVFGLEKQFDILVIDDGKISGLGTHEELLKSNAMYKETFEAQNNGGDFDEQ